MIGRRDLLVGAAASALFGEIASGELLSADEVLASLRERVDTAGQSGGIVAATFDAGKQRIVPYGRSDSANARALDGDTVFEIGSITKVFTALLLTDMVTRGEVALDDPVSKYLPDRVHLPERGGKQITLLHLASHTSGLPRDLVGVSRYDSNSFASYTVELLYNVVSNSTLQRDPGSISQYSNLGFALLGHVLTLRANTRYEDLIISRICDPFDLPDTRITLTPSMQERVAQGHRGDLRPTANWDFSPVIAGAGGLRSTANDLVRFVRATCLPGPQGPLSKAAALLLQTRYRTDAPGIDSGLGWTVRTGNDDEVIWKNGLTAGYTGYVGFSTKLKSGAVALSNTGALIDDLGFHLVNPLLPPQRQRHP